MERIRTFIAIPLPDAAREALAALRRAAPPGAPVRWTQPGSIHLTLKFLGEIEATRLDAVRGALAALPWETGAFDCTIETLGAFPSVKKPRVLWAGVTVGAERVSALADRVDAAMARLGFPREERAFTPHLTIGRVNGAGRPGWAEAFVAAARLDPLVVRAETLVLYRSRLLPSGAQYSVIDTRWLRG